MPEDELAVTPESGAAETQPTVTPAAKESTDQPEATTEPTERGSNAGEGTQTEKPTRGQRRIQDLANRVREFEQGRSQPEPWRQPQDPLQGKQELSYDDLNQAIIQRSSQIVQQELAKRDMYDQHRSTVNGWVDDVVDLTRKHPELDPESDKFDAELDETLQSLITQVNGSDNNFAPRVKASDLYKTLQKVRARAEQSGQNQTTASLAKRVADGAVLPGSQQKQSYTLDDLDKMLDKDPAKVEQILEKRVSRGT